MEQILCLLFATAVICAAFAVLGAVFELLPEGVMDALLKMFFGIKKAADPQRDSQKQK